MVAPIYQTSTFHYPAEFSEAVEGGTRLYTRYTNPSQEAAAEAIRDLERGEAGRVFASGMAAISTSVLSLVKAGDSVLTTPELYGGAAELFRDLLPRYGVRWRTVPAGCQDPGPYFDATTRVAYLETPTNPLLRVYDLAAWAHAADAHRAAFVVDNTFATPVQQRPLELGADLVVHSASKYLAGHSDVIAGAVVGRRRLLGRVADAARVLGGSLDPFAAFLLLRGIRTLPLRVARQSASAALLVERLASHPGVSKIRYPGRAGPEEEGIARRQMSGRGGVVAFSVDGGAPRLSAFLHGLKIVQVAASLGSVESLISVPAQTSHAALTPEARAELGLDEGTVRLSVGIEEVEDLWNDLEGALRSGGAEAPQRRPG